MFKSVVPFSLLALSLAACGGSSQSKLDGHYEEANASAMESYRGEQTVPAEYAPTLGVIVSQPLLQSFGREDLVKAIVDAGASTVWIVVPRNSGESLQSSSFSSLRQTLGSSVNKVQLLSQKDSGGLTVWARDWSPLGALAQNGELRLLDLNYYPDRPADDATGRAFAGFKNVSRVSVPVYNEGGNFMTNSQGYCLMTTRVTDANASPSFPGDLVLDAEDVSGYYQGFAGCRQVHIFPRMPTERTGHIDMWGKFLNDSTVIVNQISDETLATASGGDRAFAQKIQSFLEARAADVSGLGFKVVRIPMPLPRPGFFRSYTNSLLVNGTAIIPEYAASSSDADLVEGYQAAVQKTYSDLGYKTKFISSDELIRNGGAIHCVTMQIPVPRS